MAFATIVNVDLAFPVDWKMVAAEAYPAMKDVVMVAEEIASEVVVLEGEGRATSRCHP